MNAYVLIRRGDEDTRDRILGVYSSEETPLKFIDDLCFRAKAESIAKDDRYTDGKPFWPTRVVWVKDEFQIVECVLDAEPADGGWPIKPYSRSDRPDWIGTR